MRCHGQDGLEFVVGAEGLAFDAGFLVEAVLVEKEEETGVLFA